MTRLWVALAAASLLTGCAVGPRYQRASLPAPPQWKTEAPWQAAAPRDSLPKGAWWELFHDDTLKTYEQQLLAANYSLVAARDRLLEARSFARVATSGYFPTLAADPGVQRQRVSGERAALGGLPPTTPVTQTVTTIPFVLNYEADLFGSVRNNVAAANANLQASAADLANVQLVLTAELAADYFTLRELDAELNVLRANVAAQEKALGVVQKRHEGGVASGLEVAQQAALLDATHAQVSLTQQTRAQYEHAIATLTGNPAPSFSVPVLPLNLAAPPVPVGIPSDLLERRPDIATAERRMAQQNAQVGVATAAFYPRLGIGASGGLQSRDIGALFTAPSAVWALGTDLLTPIFNGGRNRSNLALARATYDESVANYRQTVLTAFQQVEDSLAALQNLSSAAASQQVAVEDSQRALTIATNRYEGGLTTYLDVVTAQTTLLNNQRLATQLLGDQMVSTVALVKALGGGWDASQIQSEQVHPTARQAVEQ